MPPPLIHSSLETLTQTANRILLLQGPIGGFFCHFAHWLSQKEKQVFKINFNYGDETYFPAYFPNTFAYRDTVENFARFIDDFIQQHHIDAVVCFGDTRKYHVIAKNVIKKYDNIRFWVFEEGYFRPNWVTLEQDGVNAFSSIPCQADFFLQTYPQLPQQDYQPPSAVPSGLFVSAIPAMHYYFKARIGKKHYPHYMHHRAHSIRYYLKNWLVSLCKRALNWSYEWHFNKRVQQGKFGRFYIVPLQVSTDSQVLKHSDFSSVRNFLLHTMSSFNIHAPPDSKLIIKHHPMDRGFINYRKYVRHFIKKHPNCKHRIFYVHDVSLPDLLRNGAGMVTINSTSGLSALLHKMPVITLGRANYDFEGLTFQGYLRDFWTQARSPDMQLFHAFRQYHLNVTQINGNFYSIVNLPNTF